MELLFKFPGDPRLNTYSWMDYVRLRDENHVFSDLLAVATSRHQVTGEWLESEVVDCMYIGGHFFDVLGLQPAIGRLISSQNDRVGSADAAVAVISWSYWQSRFSLDPAVLGRSVLVNGVPATIIGVTPREFVGVQRIDPPPGCRSRWSRWSEPEPVDRRDALRRPLRADQARRIARTGNG